MSKWNLPLNCAKPHFHLCPLSDLRPEWKSGCLTQLRSRYWTNAAGLLSSQLGCTKLPLAYRHPVRLEQNQGLPMLTFIDN